MDMSFRVWLESQMTPGLAEKIGHQARRILSLAVAQANRSKAGGKPWADFQAYGMGMGMHQAAIYHHLTARTSGYDAAKGHIGDLDDAALVSELDQAINQAVAASQAVPGASYVKGSGWHHWIINGDRDKSPGVNSNKNYISLDYKSFAKNGAAAVPAILRNLVHNRYRGQFKIIASGKLFMERDDNICIHSDAPNLKIASPVVRAILAREGVKTGGSSNAAEVTDGVDFGGSSFNDSIAAIAEKFLSKIISACRDYDHFVRNVQATFGPGGQFTQAVTASI